MAAVKCGVKGCNTRLQPGYKVDVSDRDTWLYPECDECGRPSCDGHTSWLGDQLVCDRCRERLEERVSPLRLVELGMRVDFN